jgi:tetratricopeptide (TPR) repeat protein
LKPEVTMTSRLPVPAAILLLLLGGCASAPAPQWRMEPAYRVANGMPQGNGRGYLALARKYEGELRREQALIAYRKAAAEAPDDVEVLEALGMAEAGQGQHERAVAAFRRALALAPERAGLANNLGYALLLAGRSDEAAAVLRRALELDPLHARARINLEQATVLAAVPAQPAPTAAAAPVEAVAQPQSPAVRVLIEPDLPPLQMGGAAPVQAAAAAPLAAAPASIQARVEISNGNGVAGMAAWMASHLREQGLQGRSRLSNLRPYATAATVVQYRPGFAEQARAIALRMPAGTQLVADPGMGPAADVRVVLGHDLRAQMKKARAASSAQA